MIDFKGTQQDGKTGPVEYVNEDSQIIKVYTFEEFEKWVNKTYLEFDPVHLTNAQQSEISDLIDTKWYELTEEFFNFKNPSEYKSNNSYNRTKKEVA